MMEIGNDSATSKDLMNVAREVEKDYKTAEEPDNETMDMAWDAVSGAELDPTKVRQARMEEVDYVHTMKLYDKVPTNEAYQ